VVCVTAGQCGGGRSRFAGHGSLADWSEAVTKTRDNFIYIDFHERLKLQISRTYIYICLCVCVCVCGMCMYISLYLVYDSASLDNQSPTFQSNAQFSLRRARGEYSVCFRNVGFLLPTNAASYPKTTKSSAAFLWKPQNSHFKASYILLADSFLPL